MSATVPTPGGGPAGSPVRNVLTGTVTKYALLAVNIGLGLVLMPFTIRHLGTEDYGLWMLVASLTYYFQLLDLGYGTGIVRHVSDADARGDTTRVNRILSTFVVVHAGLGLLAAVGVAALVTWVIPRFPNLDPGQIQQGQWVLAILGVRIAVGFPMTVFGAATTARQRFALNNGVAIAVALVNGLVTYVVLASGHGLLPLVAATTTVGLASYAAYAWTARVAMPELRIRPSGFSRALVAEVTTFSLYLFVIDIAVQIGFNLDNLVIGAALGTSAVAVYAVALRLAEYQRRLCNQFNGFLFPIVVTLQARGQSEAVRTMLIETTRIALILVTGATVVVVGFGAPLIELWIGPGFGGAVTPLYILAVAGVVLVGQGPLGNVLLGSGHHRLVAFASLGEALANLGLSLILVGPFGMNGVAAGTAIPVLVANLFILLPVACRRAGVPTPVFLWTVGRAPAAGLVPAIAACALVRTAWPPTTLAGVLLEGAAVGALYLTVVALVGVDRDLRTRYLGYARQALRATPLGRGRLSEAVS
ncbi:MAG: oligosaccharide flippase family protein [Vicinamibacterales bacterium]